MQRSSLQKGRVYLRQISFMRSTPGAYPRVEHQQSAGVIYKHSTKLKELARDKHSSLLRTFVNYVHKKFYNIVPDR